MKSKDLEKVAEITSKIDSTLTDLINEHMTSASQNDSETLYLTAIVSSLSFYLGKAIVQLSVYSTDEINSLVFAASKIVNQGINSYMNENNKPPELLN